MVCNLLLVDALKNYAMRCIDIRVPLKSFFLKQVVYEKFNTWWVVDFLRQISTFKLSGNEAIKWRTFHGLVNMFSKS